MLIHTYNVIILLCMYTSRTTTCTTINAHLNYPLVLQGHLWSDSLDRVPLQTSAQEVQEVLIICLDSSRHFLGTWSSLPALRVSEVLGITLSICSGKNKKRVLRQMLLNTPQMSLPKKSFLLWASDKMFALGVPKISMMQANCSASFSPGKRG